MTIECFVLREGRIRARALGDKIFCADRGDKVSGGR